MHFSGKSAPWFRFRQIDSIYLTFVQHFGDRKAARRTILIYPYKRFEMKGMMKFDKASDQIEIVPPIWDNISNKIRRVVASYCDAQLLRYYEKLETT